MEAKFPSDFSKIKNILLALFGFFIIIGLLSLFCFLKISTSFFNQNKALYTKTTIVNKWGKLPVKINEESLKFPLAVPNPPRQLSVPILMYHSVGRIPPESSNLAKELTVDPHSFEEQMKHLKETGYQTISMKDLFKALYFNYPLPPKPVILTFDDGYDNAFYYVLPILNKYHFKGTFFLITNLVDQPGRLSWLQIQRMSKAGMEFGSHTQSHADLKNLPEEQINKELRESKLIIERRLGERVYFFCYPAGSYKPEIFPLLKNQGYLLALTTNSGTIENSDHPYELPRIRISGGMPLEEFKKLLP